MKFQLGAVVGTPNALEHLTPVEITTLLDRHAAGDWGDVSPDDALLNNDALDNGDRILSAYEIEGKGRFWIITEADRSVTTLLLPGDY